MTFYDVCIRRLKFVLLNIERKNIEICSKKNDSISNAALAKLFKITKCTIDRAIKWGKKNDFFPKDAAGKLKLRTQEI